MKKLVLLAVLILGACAQPGAPPVCTGPLKSALQVDLYFGRDKLGGGEVSEAEWAAFVADTVTPRFPDGLSVLNVEGQGRDAAGRIVRERTKLLVVVVFDVPAHRAKLREIVATYNQRYGQKSVFQAEKPVCAGI